MFDHEEVEEREGIEHAREIGAIFQKISPRESTGIEDLFEKIGKKFLVPLPQEEARSINLNKTEIEERINRNKINCYMF